MVNNPNSTIELLGLEIGMLTSEARDEYNIPTDVDGVVIRNVSPDSEAARTGIREGMVIRGINQQPVSSVSDVENLVAQAQNEGRKAILLTCKAKEIRTSLRYRLTSKLI